jgi:hypothetical protein
VGPPEYVPSDDSVQSSHGPCCRRCLLKGCEQPFRPAHPCSRYCSKACQDAARDWQRWRAARQYRATAGGRERRREQSRRYRERQQQERLAATAEPAAGVREGQLKEEFCEDFSGQSCSRPGCYELFHLQPRSPLQCFCSASCRRALRRVGDREARWRRRRQLIGAGRFRPPPRC